MAAAAAARQRGARETHYDVCTHTYAVERSQHMRTRATRPFCPLRAPPQGIPTHLTK